MIDPEMILPLTLLGGIAAYFVIAPFLAKKEQNEAFDKLEEDNEDDDEIPLPNVIGAKVVKKRVGGECTGVKMPKYNAYFWITFLTDDGKELTFNVSQELFDKTNEGDVASLVTINDTFLDFTDGEEITDDEIE